MQTGSVDGIDKASQRIKDKDIVQINLLVGAHGEVLRGSVTRGGDIRATLWCTRASEGMDKAGQRIKDKDIIKTNIAAHTGRY